MMQEPLNIIPDIATVQIVPDPSIVEELEAILPEEWLQLLNIPDYETEFNQEVLEPLTSLTHTELDERIIETIEELAIDIQEIIHELDVQEHREERNEERKKEQDLDFEL